MLIYALVTRLPNHLKNFQIKYKTNQRTHKPPIAITNARESFILKLEVFELLVLVRVVHTCQTNPACLS